MAKRKNKRGASMEFYGTSELINKIENAGGNIEQAVIAALKAGAEKPRKDMEVFAEQHYKTGDMLKSLKTVEPTADKGVIKMKLGFDIKKGGLPSIFLNIGTPKIQPTFFIDKAVENNVDEIKRLQLEALNEVLKELK